MSETRKLAAILDSDIAGYSRLADEDRILARPRPLRSDLIDPTIAVHHGRGLRKAGMPEEGSPKRATLDLHRDLAGILALVSVVAENRH